MIYLWIPRINFMGDYFIMNLYRQLSSDKQPYYVYIYVYLSFSPAVKRESEAKASPKVPVRSP